MPNLYINVGNSLEVLYSADTDPARNVPYALTTVSYVLSGMLVFAVILIYKK